MRDDRRWGRLGHETGYLGRTSLFGIEQAFAGVWELEIDQSMPRRGCPAAAGCLPEVTKAGWRGGGGARRGCRWLAFGVLVVYRSVAVRERVLSLSLQKTGASGRTLEAVRISKHALAGWHSLPGFRSRLVGYILRMRSPWRRPSGPARRACSAWSWSPVDVDGGVIILDGGGV